MGDHMKRFDITNKVNGMKFMVERETLEPMQPEWGQPERTVVVTPEVPAHEIVDEETGEIIQVAAVPAVMETLPAEYEIVVTDISNEIDQRSINEAAYAFLKAADWKRNRHLSQKLIGHPLSMTDEEFMAMELEAQAARDRIVE